MLSIYLHTETGRKALDMQIDAGITIKDIAPEFNGKLDNGFYSLPIDVPMSGNNRRLLNMPENNISGFPIPEWEVDLVEDGIPIYSKIKMMLLKYTSSVDFSYGVYHMSMTGAISRFAAKSNGKRLKDLFLGGAINFAPYDSRTFATFVMKPNGPYSQYRDRIGFAPVYWPGFIDKGREDFSTEKLNYDTINCLHLEPNTGDWYFLATDYNIPGQPIFGWQPEYADYKTIPFFRLRFVLENLFKEFGYSIQGTLLNDEDFNKIYLANNYSLERCVHQNHTDYNRSIKPSNHMPDISITDFLIAFCGVFGVCFSFGENIVQINYVQDAPKKQSIDISELSDKEIEATYPDPEKNGYQIDWEFGVGDAAPGDYVLKIEPNDIIVSVNNRGDINTVTGYEDGNLLYCRSENWYYRWSEQAQRWEYHSEGQQAYETGKNYNKVSIKLSPLLQAKGKDDDNNNFSKEMLMAKGPGSYYNDSYKQVVNDFGLRMLFIDLLPMPGNQSYVVPISYNHNTDDAGNSRSRFGLNLKQEKGIVDTFKKKWLKLTNQAIFIDAQIKLPPNLPVKSLLEKKLKLGSHYYLPKEYENKKSKDGYFKITLMQL